MSLLSNCRYFAELLAPLGEVTVAMERHGVPFNAPAARELLVKVRDEETDIRRKLDAWVAEVDYIGPEMPPNWGSWQQLILFLYTPLGLNLPPAMYWKKGRTGWRETEDGDYVPETNSWGEEEEGEWKTDDVALEWLAKKHPEHAAGLELIRELRWVLRVRTYLEKWLSLCIYRDDWWWLHPSFGLASDRDERAGARTGRFAVKNPALQQVPVRGDNYGLRSLFEAPPGWLWVVIDYSQLEVVILAHLCNKLFKTDGLIQRMQPGQPDTHSLTAKYVFGDVLGDERIKLLTVDMLKTDKYGKAMRDVCKSVRYGLNYGKGKKGFGDTLFMADGTPLGEERAQQVIDALLDFDPEIRQYQDWVRWYIQKNEGITSLMGRWQPLPDANAWKTGLRNRAWRQALNYPMQAGGQEITVMAMIAIQNDPVLKTMGVHLCLQVHDELCALVPADRAKEAQARMTELMVRTVLLAAPLGASGGVGPSWGEAKH